MKIMNKNATHAQIRLALAGCIRVELADMFSRRKYHDASSVATGLHMAEQRKCEP
jgi:hypothetical protein